MDRSSKKGGHGSGGVAAESSQEYRPAELQGSEVGSGIRGS